MIETERLLLRPPVEADHPALYAMWADPVAMADLGPVKNDMASAATLARHDSYRADRLGFLSVIRQEDSAVVGFCGLKRGDPPNPIAGQVEAGWMIARPYWRRGYALEAMRAVLDWGWANLDAPHIVAITAARNAASRAMMERLGMAYVAGGDFDHHAFAADDPLRHIVTYRITRPVRIAYVEKGRR